MRPWHWSVLWLLSALAGCSTSRVTLLEGPGSVTVAEGEQRLSLKQPGEAAWYSNGGWLRGTGSRDEPDWVSASLAPAPLRFRLYFRDWNELTDESQRVYAQLLTSLRQRAPAMVSVIGHTDALGEAGYNERVGLKRAGQLARKLQASGIELLQLRVASHGEADPLRATPDETYEPLNRRVEVWVQ